MPDSMMRVRGVSMVKSILEVDSGRLARSEFLRLKPTESIERVLFRSLTSQGDFELYPA